MGIGKKSMEKVFEKFDEVEFMCVGVVKFFVLLVYFIIVGVDFLMVSFRFESCGLI